MTEDQVSSGEFADLRPNPRVYLDSNIVSAIAKDDIPTEPASMGRQKGRFGHLRGDAVGIQRSPGRIKTSAR
jgi:hypothetical protein